LPISTLEPIAQHVAEAIEKEVGEFPSESPCRQSKIPAAAMPCHQERKCIRATSLAHRSLC
jgi:hypothetical protein